MRHRTTIALGAVLLTALSLRFWGIAWGMPYAFHADENNYLPGAIKLLVNSDPNPHYFNNPPLLTYIVTAELLVYSAIMQAVGVYHSLKDLFDQLYIDPTRLYIIARANSAIMGTGAVLATFLTAKKLFDEKVGLLAALLLAVAFLPVRDSHYAVNDVPATFFLSVTFYFATRIYATGRLRDYLLGGIFLGLGVATKYNVGLGAVVLVAAHLLAKPTRTALLKPSTHLSLVLAGAVSLAAFVVADPYSVLDSQSFLRDFRNQYGWASNPYNTNDLSMGGMILRTLATGTGIGTLVLALMGLLVMAVRKPSTALLAAVFPAVYLGFFLFGSDLFYSRFAIPAIPSICLLAGYGGVELLRLLKPPQVRAIAGLALLLLVIGPQVALDVRHNELLRREDTRLALGRWVEENVPPGSKLAVEGYTFLDTEGRTLGPRRIPYGVEVVSSITARTPEQLAANKTDYLIVSSFVYGRYLLDTEAHGKVVDLYGELDRLYPVVGTIQPTADGHEIPFIMDEEITPIFSVMERSNPGPTLKIYRVADAPSYRVEWTKADVPASMSAGKQTSATVAIRNSGNLTWPADGYNACRIGYRWLDATGQVSRVQDIHSPIPRGMAPGASAEVPIVVAAPSTAGSYTLRLDVVQENFAWLSAKGAATVDIPVTVK